MRVLVTGGGGYLGCHLVPLLLEQGHEVRVFDRFCFGDEPVAAFADYPHCEVIRGDVRRLQEAPALLDGIDAVVHLAGLTNDPSCALDPEMAADVNVESTRELANQAAQHGVTRFVFASSCNVYGHGVFEFLDEESPPNPVSTFAKTKIAAETALLQMAGEHFEPVVARNATLFGWSPRMRFDVAIHHMVAHAVRTNGIKVMGGGNQWRPFIHVHDAARAFLALLEAPASAVSGQVFNVGDDNANIRIIDLARRVAETVGDVPIEIPKDDDELRDYRVQFGKIRDTLGFHCEHTIQDGINEIYDALRGNPIDPFDEIFFNAHRMKRLRATPVGEGGEPIAARFIPLAKPTLGEEEEEAVIEALRSGWLTSGPHLQAFEKAFADTVAAPHAIAVSSCTAALHLCLHHLGVRPGDEVITSPITWASTGNTVLHMGAKLVFADIERDSLNISPEAIERAITDRTRVIMPVHLAGRPCDLDAIHAIGERHGIPVVEDAAHALGAAYKGAPIGNCGPYACFSFYAIKNITTMEGGTITVQNQDDADHLRLLAANGLQATAWERYGRSAVAAPAQVVDPGYKYLMGNISAAMGVQQLKKFASFKAARRRLVGMYRAVLADVDEIALPAATNGDWEHAWHLFVIRLDLDKLTKTRDEIAADLRRENIGTGVHFYGLHLHPYYRETFGLTPEDFPEATAASNEVLSLPLHPQMTDRNVHEVVEALKKVLAHAH
ncbi:MAG: aminotransferase class I/II-fold pyridoxal phosphate-dependent enzyme [Nitrospiraceae bacterium]|nr:aminotransferase class I/II-fold pyridoxal phosphate-dependent enzyme [Nitrospiraceae bacterium]